MIKTHIKPIKRDQNGFNFGLTLIWHLFTKIATPKTMSIKHLIVRNLIHYLSYRPLPTTKLTPNGNQLPHSTEICGYSTDTKLLVNYLFKLV